MKSLKYVFVLFVACMIAMSNQGCAQDDLTGPSTTEPDYNYTVKTVITQIYKSGKIELVDTVLDNIFKTNRIDTISSVEFLTTDSTMNGIPFYRTKMDYYITYKNNNTSIDYLWEIKDPNPVFADDIYIQSNQTTGNDERHTWMIDPYTPLQFNHLYSIDISILTVQ